MKAKILFSIFLVLILAGFVSAQCTDTDGGVNYYQKGVVTSLNYYGTGENLTQTDACEDNGIYLQEKWCSEDGIGISGNEFQCPNGCVNGVCVGTTPQEPLDITKCEGSDNMSNFNSESIKITYNDGTFVYFNDTCQGNKAIHYFCGYIAGNKAHYWTNSKVCSGSCLNGACITTYTHAGTYDVHPGDIISFNGLTVTIQSISFDWVEGSPYFGMSQVVLSSPGVTTIARYQQQVNLLRTATSPSNDTPIGVLVNSINFGDQEARITFIDLLSKTCTDIPKDTCAYSSGGVWGLRHSYCNNGEVTYTTTECPAGCTEQYCSYCKVDSCITPTILTPEENQTPIQIPQENETSVYVCQGCNLDNNCYSFGFRKAGNFCSDTNKSFVEQKQADSACENNFECTSNVCVSGNCVSESFLQKIINWFKSLFGIA